MKLFPAINPLKKPRIFPIIFGPRFTPATNDIAPNSALERQDVWTTGVRWYLCEIYDVEIDDVEKHSI